VDGEVPSTGGGIVVPVSGAAGAVEVSGDELPAGGTLLLAGGTLLSGAGAVCSAGALASSASSEQAAIRPSDNVAMASA